MADKGIGTGVCEKHGKYFLDTTDSPCPSCEDEHEEVHELWIVCPKDPSHREFCAGAIVCQDWLVDGNGDFLKELDGCSQVYRFPDTDDEWVCNECGEIAVKGGKAVSQDMIAKIKKLMALSHGEGNEAETAAKMAQKLMIKHAIEMADLEEHEKTVVDPLVVNRIKVGRRAWPIQLAWALGPHCRIKVLRTSRWDGVYAVGYGHQSDVQVWQYLYGIAAREIQKMAKVYGKEHTYFCWKRDKEVVDRKLTSSFRMGCVEGLSSKLREQRRAEKVENSNSTALILQDRMQASSEFMKSKVGSTGTWSGTTRGNSDGYRAGKTISLNTGIGGRKQNQIGGK